MRSDKTLSTENREALRWFAEEGGLFTVITGRTPLEMAGFDCSILSAPMIVSSGSLILDRGTASPIYDAAFTDQGYEIAQEIWREFPTVQSLIVDEHMTYPQLSRDTDLEFQDLRRALPYPWHKVLLVVADAGHREPLERSLQERYGTQYVFDSAWERSVEMHRGDKGSGALELKRSLGAKVLCCVGDHTNDIPMICAADIGCAMGNALDAVRAAADYILPSNDEDGIAYLIHHLIKWAEERQLV